VLLLLLGRTLTPLLGRFLPTDSFDLISKPRAFAFQPESLALDSKSGGLALFSALSRAGLGGLLRLAGLLRGAMFERLESEKLDPFLLCRYLG
jgi:hypothetical protein